MRRGLFYVHSLAAPVPKKGSETYNDWRAGKAEEFREKSTAGRDIGEIPLCANPARRAAAEQSLLAFTQYFPESFYLSFSPDHLRVIAKIEEAARHGGLFALAMPRGSGKTTLCITGAMWAILYGYHDFVLLVGASEPAATDMLDSIRMQLETNDLLLADFPEVCYPIRKLDGIKQRRLIYKGSPVRMTFVEKEIILPDIAMRPIKPEPIKRGRGRPKRNLDGIPAALMVTEVPNKSASAVIGVAGITGRIRGRRVTRPDGKDVRPSFVLPDDPQTDESAKSPQQCTERLKIMNGAILGLSGPGKKISGVVPCTVIVHNDMADQLLDRQRNPQWQGEKTKLIYAWPDDMTALDPEGGPKRVRHWDRYAELRAIGLRSGEGVAVANVYLAEHHEEMHRGSQVAWPERFNQDEISALQNAINIRLDRGIPAFEAEYQNSPLKPQNLDEIQLEPHIIAGRLNRLPRGVVSAPSTQTVAFIDVMEKALYWVACSFESDFSGQIVDYGTYPDQGRNYFTLGDVKNTLELQFPGMGLEGRIYAGLERLTEILLLREWPRDGGQPTRLNRVLIDSGWQADVIHKFVSQSRYAGMLIPSKGRGINATEAPMENWAAKPGQTRGNKWILQRASGRATASVQIDTNFWKTFVSSRLNTAMGDRGALSFYGATPEPHKMICDHICAETRIIDEARGRRVDVWQAKPNQDNHWFDGVVGCHVAASIGGIVLREHEEKKRHDGPRPSLGDYKRRAHAG